MPWYKVCLSLDDVTGGLEFKIQDEFKAVFMASSGPRDAALFSGMLDDGGIEMFFSPEASQIGKTLIDKYQGKECEKPAVGKLALLIGHDDARSRFL